jgi:CheY-like chemotaxis protein
LDRPVKHVLVVEDHEQTRSAISRTLEQLGFIVYARASAEDAAGREDEHKHLDLALLDVILPGQRGDEYGVVLRTRFPRLPIIFMTADTDCDRIQKNLPDAQILRKPISVPAILGSFIY